MRVRHMLDYFVKGLTPVTNQKLLGLHLNGEMSCYTDTDIIIKENSIDCIICTFMNIHTGLLK